MNAVTSSVLDNRDRGYIAGHSRPDPNSGTCDHAGEAQPCSGSAIPADQAPTDDTQLRFRSYRLLPAARLLIRENEPVVLGGRAFDLLHFLVRHRGRLVTRDQIVGWVWPNTFVEESNLRFQVACLRKVLGPDRDLIRTIPGRGYLFAADLPGHSSNTDAAGSAVSSAAISGPSHCDLVNGGIADRSELMRLYEAVSRLAELLERSIQELFEAGGHP